MVSSASHSLDATLCQVHMSVVCEMFNCDTILSVASFRSQSIVIALVRLNHVSLVLAYFGSNVSAHAKVLVTY